MVTPRTTLIKKLFYILIENLWIIQTYSVCLLVSELSSAEYVKTANNSKQKQDTFIVAVLVLQNDAELDHFTLLSCSAEDGYWNVPTRKMHVRSILLLIKPFVQRLFRCRCRCAGFLKHPNKFCKTIFITINVLYTDC